MRNRQPLLALQQGAKGAAPARDFKGALVRKMQETGGGAWFHGMIYWLPDRLEFPCSLILVWFA
jgi:hypothetical protein